MKPDLSKVPAELQAKIRKWEENSPANQAMRTATKAAEGIEELKKSMAALNPQMSISVANLEESLGPITELLEKIRDKEMDLPDYAQPVVEAFTKLEAAVKAVKVKPEFKPNITVESPSVTVEAPRVDLSRVEKILKTEIPAAFAQAISLIPATEIPENDFGPLVDKFDAVLERLGSLETATRMKPLPGSMRVSNLDEVTSELQTMNAQYAAFQFDPSDATPTYIGKNELAIADNDRTDWVIYKFTYSGSDVTDIRKKTGSWTSRASLF